MDASTDRFFFMPPQETKELEQELAHLVTLKNCELQYNYRTIVNKRISWLKKQLGRLGIEAQRQFWDFEKK